MRHLIENLPSESATVRALTEQDGKWSLEEKLLAVVAEQTDAVYRAMVMAWSDPKKLRRPPKPLRIDWPGRMEEAYLGRMREQDPERVRSLARRLGARVKVVRSDDT